MKFKKKVEVKKMLKEVIEENKTEPTAIEEPTPIPIVENDYSTTDTKLAQKLQVKFTIMGVSGNPKTYTFNAKESEVKNFLEGGS